MSSIKCESQNLLMTLSSFKFLLSLNEFPRTSFLILVGSFYIKLGGNARTGAGTQRSSISKITGHKNLMSVK